MTTRYGWQQHWSWSDIESVSTGTQRISFRMGRGCTVEFVATLLTSRDDDRLNAFTRQVQALAVVAGVPVVPAPTLSQRYRRWRQRDRSSRRRSSAS